MYAAGHLLFLQGDDLMAQPFDPKRLSRSGAASRLVQNVASDPKYTITSSGYGAAGFSASPMGTLVYRPGGATSVLAVVDRTSGVTTPLVEPGYYLDPALSPDGTRVAFAKRESLDAANDIWILDLANNNRRSRFTSEGGENRAPLWTPDGKAIVFSSSQGGRTALYLKSAVGPGTPEPLIEPSHRQVCVLVGARRNAARY